MLPKLILLMQFDNASLMRVELECGMQAAQSQLSEHKLNSSMLEKRLSQLEGLTKMSSEREAMLQMEIERLRNENAEISRKVFQITPPPLCSTILTPLS